MANFVLLMSSIMFFPGMFEDGQNLSFYMPKYAPDFFYCVSGNLPILLSFVCWDVPILLVSFAHV